MLHSTAENIEGDASRNIVKEGAGKGAQFPHPLLPYASRYITVAGYKMHYIDEGSGPVVLLLHGNPTWCFYYRNLIARLKENFRVIAPDFIGLGLSDHPPYARFRASDRIDHIEEFTQKLGIEKTSLVMHDWGGSIGTGFAVRHPERIERIVYLNTTLTETESLPFLIKSAASPFFGKILTKYTRQFLRFTTGAGLGVAHKLPREVRDGYFMPYKTVGRRVAIWNFVDDIPFTNNHPSYSSMLDLADNLHKLQNHPIQIVWGLKDPCFHRDMLNKVTSHFPKASVYEIAEASHLVLEDAPEVTANVIEDFLQGKPSELIDSESNHFATSPDEQNALYGALAEFAKNSPLEGAVIEPLILGDSVRYGHTSYEDLITRIYQYQRGFSKLGMKSGDKVLMLVPPGVSFLTLSYAVMANGAVPVFMDPGMGREKLFRCIKDLCPDILIGSPKAQLLRFKKKELFPNLKFHITASDWLYTGGPGLSFLKRFSTKPLPPAKSTGVAFVAYTSGATGVPKGVVFTNKMIRAQLKIFREQFGLESGKKDLPLLPIFSLFQSALGICSVIPPLDPASPLSLTPEKILRVIHDLHIDSSFGSPTLWNKIAEYCKRSGKSLGTIRKVFMAGAPISREVLERVGQVLEEGGEAYTPYGATEALPVTMISSNEILSRIDLSARDGERGTYVGKAVKGVSLRVIQPSDSFSGAHDFQDLPPRTIGEIVVSGDNISPEYFQRPEATSIAKVQDDGDQFWHRMGDMGYFDEDGGLYFCGRKAHVVSSPSRTYYSVPTERVFNDCEKIKRSALVALAEESEPGIVLEPYPQYWPDSQEKKASLLKEIEEIAKAHELTSQIKWFLFHPSFPVDARHNAKIYRDQLSDWAKDQIHVSNKSSK